MPLTLSPQVFSILSALIEERCGLHYSATDLELLAHKVVPRAYEAGFESMLDYYYFLRYDPGGEAEFDQLVECLIVGETYFFRERDPLEVMIEEFVAPAVREGRRPRIWSAACATGEEPLTIAMMLAARGLLDQVSILATDISARALERAQRGVFGRRSLRSEPPPACARYLETSADQVRVAASLIDRISWRRLNLTDDAAVQTIPEVDVVLCRNVLIYFAESTARAVVARLASRLRPRGALFVGVSESLLRFGTALSCEERDGVFFYRRTA